MAEIHIVGDEGDIEVWLDTEVQDCDGLCIGHAETKAGALADAQLELRARLDDVLRLLREAYPKAEAPR